jgi:hypothetical protein
MNNCPKCGNPLQAGVTSCPICGTNITIEAESKQVTVDSVAQTAAPAEAAPAAAPAQAAEQVQATQPIDQQTIQPTAQSAPAPEATPAPVMPTVPAAEPAVQEQAAQPVQPAPVAEAVQPVPAVTPTPAVEPTPSVAPTAVVAPIAPAAAAPVVNANVEPEKPKRKKNKLLPVLLLLIFVGAGVYVYLNFFSGTNQVQQPKQTAQKNVAVPTKEVVANGFDFKVTEGWIVREDYDDVIINNENETVIIKLTHVNRNIESLTEDGVKMYLTNRGIFENVEVKSSKINAKDTLVVDGVHGEKPFQLYFMDGGQDLMLGVMVVYAGKAESKTVNEAAVQEIIGSISYSETGTETININSTYSDIFGSFSGAISSSLYTPEPEPETPEEPETPVEPVETPEPTLE